MKNSIFSARSKRGRIFAVITVVGIALVLGLNLLLTYFGLHKTVFIDMTKEGFYTLTDKMVEHCGFVEELKDENGKSKPIEITFCADPDTLMASEVTRIPYVMSLKLANKFDNINIKTVNVANDPTSVAMYKTTSMTTILPSDIIVSYGSKYRISSAQSFWTSANDALWSYNGEYKMTSIIMSLTSINQPAAYFITGHGETYYDINDPESAGSLKSAALFGLLTERGLTVKTLDLSSVTAIPDDCALLILNNPQSDFEFNGELNSFDYVSDLEKIDRYLTKGNGSLMVAKDYATELPLLESFLFEWGFEFSDTKVKDENNSLPVSGGADFAPIIGVYETEENSYGNAIYGDYAASGSSPKMIFTNTGYISCSFGLAESAGENGADNVNRHFAPFITTSDGAAAYKKNESGFYTDRATEKQELNLAAVCSRHYTHEYDATTTYSYVFCANSPEFLSNELLGNPSYANFDIVSAVVNNMVRTDMHASSDLGGTSLNSSSFGGKQIIDQELHEEETKLYSTDANNIEVLKVNSGIDNANKTVITVFVFLIPAAIAVVGIIVCVRRRFL